MWRSWPKSTELYNHDENRYPRTGDDDRRGIQAASPLPDGTVHSMTPLAGWENFYVIVGSSAGALIGLQFVVITLIADLPVARGPVQAQASNAFATPTVVHFSAVLGLAAIASVPWRATVGPEILWGILGLVGIVYEIVIVRRMRSQPLYQPQFEDWLFH